MSSSRSSQRGAPGRACLVACLALLAAPAGLAEARGWPTATVPGPARLAVELDGSVLSVRARGVALGAVLAEVARRSDLQLEIEGRLDRPVSLQLERLPLREALDRLLAGHAFVLRLVEPSAPGPSTAGAPPSALWVFADPSGRRLPRSEGGEAGSPCPLTGGGEAPPAEACPDPLRLALSDPDEKVRLRAVAELAGAGGDRESAEKLTRAALLDPHPAVREEAVYALGEIGAEGALETLRTTLADPHPRVRRAAVEAAAELGGDEAAWTLAAALQDGEPALREQAVYALAEIGGEVAATLLAETLADGEALIRQAAAEALAELAGGEEAGQ